MFPLFLKAAGNVRALKWTLSSDLGISVSGIGPFFVHQSTFDESYSILLLWLSDANTCSSTTVTPTHTHRHTHAIVLRLFWILSGTTWVSQNQKGKTNLDLLEQETVSGSGISWAMCNSAPHPSQPRQRPTTQFFTGQIPFLPPNQQRQSTEGTTIV